ncbi:hypothetical protein INP57_22020 [Saccharopolyspora sp. HNM0986]|uniref:hypothetical protein n=2 Tax=Saccharopolyspora TaxID=1835 RepID=UPI00190BFFA9|nr:hypothetical protein [Saccharopolyspora sp. HNM0986]MBK0869493.1 hypothetical protein [Saccharopolyspora sp. HNM0986]
MIFIAGYCEDSDRSIGSGIGLPVTWRHRRDFAAPAEHAGPALRRSCAHPRRPGLRYARHPGLAAPVRSAAGDPAGGDLARYRPERLASPVVAGAADAYFSGHDPLFSSYDLVDSAGPLGLAGPRFHRPRNDPARGGAEFHSSPIKECFPGIEIELHAVIAECRDSSLE